MDRIESFQVNHLKLKPGLYLSRIDRKDSCEVRTFDLRLTAPNVEEVLDSGSLHTIEHIGATFLRNSAIKDDVVYFGPMGCRTGFYLAVFGGYTPEKMAEIVKKMCGFIADFEGEIPGATPIECGNYSDQNLPGAKKAAQKYLQDLETFERFEYPE